jgi:hypothetical protein
VIMGGSQHRYTCSAFHGGGYSACSNHITVPRAVAELAILAPIKEKLLSPNSWRTPSRLSVDWLGLNGKRRQRKSRRRSPEWTRRLLSWSGSSGMAS